ncbi:fatty acid hydroxylase superfamily-domain-containing protein [Halteromyces radiatus]|uniref:fatty acid hydroxylase superfamily-domain-containing protein n=1 Tax=Halteromyces radiatus TaxID=101107 RepID=UPI00221EEF91|nr:fatty acid hydroxylase superfamily-domain-containing protein [Halteromyces radiatus]KAI8086141.1 fatty acid hydroxylase superfamily-domain-containing protein [Halteromyces radiatus]
MNYTHYSSLLKLYNVPDFWTDEMLALWVPIAIYWIQCSFFEILMRLQLPFFEKYRIHSSIDRSNRNKVSFGNVLYMVAVQHIIQFIFGYFLLKVEDPATRSLKSELAIQRTTQWILSYIGNYQLNDLVQLVAWMLHIWVIPIIQFLLAMFMIDTHQYILHRLGHTSKFLYKHFHSYHHRLYVPYAFGALYNHPVEGFCLDTLGAGLAYELTGMSPRLGLILFTFSNLKTINDHCGYNFPWDPLNILFKNNGKYHDIHHQPYGIKKNFSQPFFTFWDRKLGTEFDSNDMNKRRNN